jgi:nucleotide-binding universal stress UspA family protein
VKPDLDSKEIAMNVKHILCPVDFSEHGEAAISYATSLAKEYNAELHFVHVFEEPHAYVDGGFASAPLPAIDLDEEKAKLDLVEPASPDVAYRRKMIVGRPSEELVKYAAEESIDLIIMGTHGRTGLGRLLMGSVAESIVRKATCPVLTIRQPTAKLQESS